MVGITRSGSGALGGGVAGLGGVAMFIACAWLITSNESRTALRTDAIDELATVVKSVPADAVDPANAGKPVHIKGRLETETGAHDEEFHFGGDDFLLIDRSVEMYQWTSYKKDNQTRWKMEWDDDANDGNSNHPNPPFPLQAQRSNASDAHVGAFAFTGDLDDFSDQRLLPTELDASLTEQGWVSYDGRLYLSAGAPQQPQVGDLRVAFDVLKELEVSEIGTQEGQGIGSWKATNGDSLLVAAPGLLEIPGVIAHARSSNATQAWLSRVAGVGGMALGLGMVFRGWLGIFAWIPLLGALLQRAAFGAGIALGGGLGIMLLSGAWLYAHPKTFYAVLALAVIGTVALMKLRKPGVAPVPQGMPQPPPPPPR
jgi:hypothetical protein